MGKKKENSKDSGKNDPSSQENEEAILEEYITYRNLGSMVYEIPTSALEQPAMKKYRSMLLRWVQDLVMDKDLVVKTLEDTASVVILRAVYGTCTQNSVDLENLPRTYIETLKEIEKILVLFEKSLCYKSTIQKWSAIQIFYRYIPSVLHLLTALYFDFKSSVAPYTEKIEIPIRCISEKNEIFLIIEKIYDPKTICDLNKTDEVMMRLFQDPKNCAQFEEGITGFLKTHLEPMGRTIDDLTLVFRNGINLILLCGSIENFYVPLWRYIDKPVTENDMSDNIKYGFELLCSMGISTAGFTITDILRGDRNATLKLLYVIFKKYK